MRLLCCCMVCNTVLALACACSLECLLHCVGALLGVIYHASYGNTEAVAWWCLSAVDLGVGILSLIKPVVMLASGFVSGLQPLVAWCCLLGVVLLLIMMELGGTGRSYLRINRLVLLYALWGVHYLGAVVGLEAMEGWGAPRCLLRCLLGTYNALTFCSNLVMKHGVASLFCVVRWVGMEPSTARCVPAAVFYCSAVFLTAVQATPLSHLRPSFRKVPVYATKHKGARARRVIIRR